jgi:hypothetical protein
VYCKSRDRSEHFQSLQSFKVLAKQKMLANSLAENSANKNELDSESDDDDDFEEIASFRVSRQEDRRVYDSAADLLKKGEPCTVQLKCLGLHHRYRDLDDSVCICVAVGALGLRAVEDKVMMQTVWSIAASFQSEADNKDSMALGLLAATESELPALAIGLQVDTTLLHHPMAMGTQFDLKPEVHVKSCTTCKAFADDSGKTAARHVILQTIERIAKNDQYPDGYLVVDLVSLATDIATDGLNDETVSLVS